MGERIRVLLADDHTVLRQGTAELLRREPDLEVVGEAADGEQAVALSQRLQPDVVVMDVRMPTLSGVEATRRIRELCPEVQVLVLTAHDDDRYVFSLLQAGASGYLLKTAPIHDLVDGIRQVVAGESPLDPAIARKIVLHFSGGHPQDARQASTLEELTPREQEVLQLLARGLSNQAIADSLFISERTVHAHLSSIFSKMQVGSRLEAVLHAIRLGWLTIDL